MNKLTQEEVDQIITQHNDIQLVNPDNLEDGQLEESLARFENVDLQGITFEGTDLSRVYFDRVDLRGVNFTYANCKNSDFLDCDIRGANLTGANFSDADVRGIIFDKNIICRGIHISNSYGSPRFKRFAEHQNYIEEIKSDKNKFVIYHMWRILSDCGRSLFRWGLWAVILSIIYGFIFFFIGADSFQINSTLNENSHELFIMIYYSVVTFTTLGFGDVTPVTTGAAIAVMLEVITGYIMLGGLISIFSSKLVER